MSQPLITERDFCPKTGDIPQTVQDRIAAFIVESIAGMHATPSTSKMESIMPGARFHVGGFAVRVDGIRVTVTAPAK